MAMRPRYLVTTLAALCWAPAAVASPTYPGVIRDHYGLDRAPPCTLCHADNGGGRGTVVTPFGLDLMAHGLGEKENAKLVLILDEQGVTKDDVEALIDCGDDCADEPTYGCSVTAATAPASTATPASTAALLAAALVAAAFTRRRRARARST